MSFPLSFYEAQDTPINIIRLIMPIANIILSIAFICIDPMAKTWKEFLKLSIA
jgi:hypothetical protein